MRFRLLLITFGAVLVALTFTFPFWIELIERDQAIEPDEIFPGLSANMQELFLSLPPDQQTAYRAAAEQDRGKAVAMIESALSPGFPAPEEQQELPAMTGAETIATGSFTRIDPIRWAQGDVTLYQQVDNSKVLRFENFSMVNAPSLRLVLASPPPADATVPEGEEPPGPIDYILEDGFDIGPLLGVSGNQNYDIASEIDISPYNSVVIYSPTLEMVFSIAPLTRR